MVHPSTPPETPAEQGCLESLFFKDGDFGISVLGGDVPEFLVQANTSLRSGRLQKVSEIISDSNVEIVRQIVRNDPRRTDIMFILARLFFDMGRLDCAEQWYKEILEQETNALVLNELGTICKLTCRPSEEVQYRKKASETDPESADIFINYVLSVIRTGLVEDGINLLRDRLQKDPIDSMVRSAYLWAIHYLPEPDPKMFCAEHKEWAQIHAPASFAKTHHCNDPDPDRRLRIGYISANFKRNLSAYNFHAFLKHRNHEVVEAYGYGKVAVPDDFTEVIKQSFDHYRDILGLSEETIVSMIEEDGIDILVNTGGGHEVDNGYCIMRYKPAPIQVDYGAINTTGMEQVDYRLTDGILDPVELRKFYVEESVCLPAGFFIFSPPSGVFPVTSLPAIERGHVTFGSFNNNCKINPFIMALWARILKQIPGSRLLLKFSIALDRQITNRYVGEFEQLGIERERVEIHGIKPYHEHMRFYGDTDIALDTYPFNGCMTTLECLWMGVPVVSMFGSKSFLSRTGLSILSRVGLEIFAARDEQEYVAKAVAFAGQFQELAAIRASLRKMVSNSPLCDADRFAAGVEAAYRRMWHKWCQGCQSIKL